VVGKQLLIISTLAFFCMKETLYLLGIKEVKTFLVLCITTHSLKLG